MKNLIIFKIALLLSAQTFSQTEPPLDPQWDCLECGTDNINISTGFNHALGAEYNVYSRDEYWSVTHLAEPAPHGTAVDHCAWVIPPAEIWTPDIDPNGFFIGFGNPDPNWRSQWISTHPSSLYFNTNLAANCVGGPTGGPIRFTRKFEVCAGPTVDLNVALFILSDGFVGEVYLDAVPMGWAQSNCSTGNYDQPMNGGATYMGNWHGVSSGQHSISFVLYNNFGSYAGVNVQGAITSHPNKLTSTACYGKNDCEALPIPLCEDILCRPMGGITQINGAGRTTNNDCIFNCVASEDPKWSGWSATSYIWFNESLENIAPGVRTSSFNANAPNGDSSSVTLGIIYTNGDGESCASYHSQILTCELIDDDPGGGDNRVSGVSTNTGGGGINIFPNPGADAFNFSSTVQSLIVTDLLGREVMRARNVEKVDASTWLKGTYIFQFTVDGVSGQHRVIKN